MVKGGDESPDEYHVAIDDGTSAKAWDFTIGSEPYRLLTPGTFVHARVNLRNRAEQTVEPVEPPTVARPLAEVAAEQQRAVRRPAGPGHPGDRRPGGRDSRWPGPGQPCEQSRRPGDDLAATGTAEPVLRIDVRDAHPRPAGDRGVNGMARTRSSRRLPARRQGRALRVLYSR